MLGFDTNVLVRFLGQDDQAQFARTQKIIGRESRKGSGVLISLLVLLQTEWVLRGRYSLTKAEILAAFSPSSANSIIRCGRVQWLPYLLRLVTGAVSAFDRHFRGVLYALRSPTTHAIPLSHSYLSAALRADAELAGPAGAYRVVPSPTATCLGRRPVVPSLVRRSVEALAHWRPHDAAAARAIRSK